jgi:chorismate mutase
MNLRTKKAQRQTKIDALRAAIAKIDHDLLIFLRARLDAAKEIGVIKLHEGKPLRDPDAEQMVRMRNQKSADQLGIPGNLAHELSELLIHYSVQMQAEVMQGGIVPTCENAPNRPT